MTGLLEADAPSRHGRLTRSRREKMIAGVCGGLAEYFGLDPTLVRLAYLFVSIMTIFPGIIAYIVLMFVMPSDSAEA